MSIVLINLLPIFQFPQRLNAFRRGKLCSPAPPHRPVSLKASFPKGGGRRSLRSDSNLRKAYKGNPQSASRTAPLEKEPRVKNLSARTPTKKVPAPSEAGTPIIQGLNTSPSRPYQACQVQQEPQALESPSQGSQS